MDQRLVKGFKKLGYEKLTLVQKHCIPLALEGKDLLVKARTGSGKTAAFGIPLLQKILSSKGRGIVLVPTKELVEQTKRAMFSLMYYCKDTVSLLGLGDEDMETQVALLRKVPDIIVSTPGKLVDHVKRGSLDLSVDVHTLVLDEADMVLSFGYESDIRKIFSALPKNCQSFFMSATLSEELNQLKRAVLHTPAVVKLEGGETDGVLQQFYVQMPSKDKDLLLYALLKLGMLQGKVLFFTNSNEHAYRLKLFFQQFSIKSAVLNGKLPFNSRDHIIQEFNKGIVDYLIATDDSIDHDTPMPNTDGSEDEANTFGVSRGVDFREIAFVVNVDFPKSFKSYVHRIGRTARGGASGTALSLVGHDDAFEMEMLAKVQHEQQALTYHPEKLQGSLLADEEADGVVTQPAPLAFDMKEIDCFRYRVEDVRRAVTGIGVKQAQIEDLKKEMLNSEKLKDHFEDNPRDLNIVQHDKALGAIKVQPHLAHIPSYLVPTSMLPTATSTKSKKRSRTGQHTNDKRRRTKNDPLHTFQHAQADDAKPTEDRITNGDGVGASTSGRQRWKESHRKGKFSNKYKNRDGKGYAH